MSGVIKTTQSLREVSEVRSEKVRMYTTLPLPWEGRAAISDRPSTKENEKKKWRTNEKTNIKKDTSIVGERGQSTRISPKNHLLFFLKQN